MTVMHSISPPAPDVALAGRQTLAEYLQRLSEDEFYAFCQQNRDQKFERRADGTIELMSLTGGESGRRNSRLTSRLDRWAEDSGLGVVFDSSTGFRLPNGAVRSPDAAWVSQAAWEALTPEQRRKHVPLCPDFAVELLSETDTISDIVVKMQEYLDNGLRLGWLIDPKTETARVFRANGSVEVRNFAETLSGEDVLPGFTFALRTLS
ncbi:Uma2 family endonuclease [Hymenobacter rubidus]|uniref:Uma2 family endonuclease n=1 Tax=Hymenobacter rubidus TaxID=1441626 RepID=UPI00191FD235|nr:Uma2 family endonuclease [Hymenobacter rubidus]